MLIIIAGCDQVDLFAISKNNKYIVSGSHDFSIRLWNIDTGKCIKILKNHTSWVTAVAFSSIDPKYILSGSLDMTVCLWNIELDTCVQMFQGHTSRVNTVAFSSSNLIVSGSLDNTVRVWEVEMLNNV